jgi:hypothetical protein
MTARGAEYEFMFGDTACLITITAHPQAAGHARYLARLYVLGYRGLSMRPVGDADGTPVEFTSDSDTSALTLASDYLADRFGPRRAADAPTTSYVTSRTEQQPPLRDDRPAPMVVLALERIYRGDFVVVTKDGAKRARRPTPTPGAILASAIEDIEKGHRGRVRQLTE